jgi:phosphate starvation-inducible membrane PsiE
LQVSITTMIRWYIVKQCHDSIIILFSTIVLWLVSLVTKWWIV